MCSFHTEAQANILRDLTTTATIALSMPLLTFWRGFRSPNVARLPIYRLSTAVTHRH
jgi:hypothetical protein